MTTANEPRVFGRPMAWPARWDERSMTGVCSKQSYFKGAVGEDFLARHVLAALHPAQAAGAILGLPSQDPALGDVDMVIHISARGLDHLMLVDAKHTQSAELEDRQVTSAQKRVAELVGTGALGETRRGRSDGWNNVRVSYHFVFTDMATTKEWQQNLRTGEVLEIHHPSRDVHDPEFVVVASSYETLLGDVLCRALQSTVPDRRDPDRGTQILGQVADAYFPDQTLRPFASIVDRDEQRLAQWRCSAADCWASSATSAPGSGLLAARVHDAHHRKLGQRPKRHAAELVPGDRGIPTWEGLSEADEKYGWEPGTAAGWLLFGDGEVHDFTCVTVGP